MTYSADNDPVNLPEFDLEVFEIALKLGLEEEDAWEIAVEVAKQDDCEFIPLDDFDLSSN
jgi:hypothetical protein